MEHNDNETQVDIRTEMGENTRTENPKKEN